MAWRCHAMRLLLLVILTSWPLTSAAQQCRQALVLALDVSGSVDEVEFAQQINGLAAALDDPEVRSLILFGADAPVMLTVFEWSSQNHQYLIQPWVRLDSPAALDGAIARIRAHRKVRAGLKTALGRALEFSAALLSQHPRCWRHTIDISGDGKNNIGPEAHDLYALRMFDRITVNALVVGNPSRDDGAAAGITSAELQAYFQTEVIHGPDAFAMVSDGYADYARAMQRKLIQELAFPVLGAAPHPVQRINWSADN